jgi:hypothetical protein
MFQGQITTQWYAIQPMMTPSAITITSMTQPSHVPFAQRRE